MKLSKNPLRPLTGIETRVADWCHPKVPKSGVEQTGDPQHQLFCFTDLFLPHWHRHERVDAQGAGAGGRQRWGVDGSRVQEVRAELLRI